MEQAGLGRESAAFCVNLLKHSMQLAGGISPLPATPLPPPPPPCTIQVGVVLLAEGLAHGGGGRARLYCSCLSPVSHLADAPSFLFLRWGRSSASVLVLPTQSGVFPPFTPESSGVLASSQSAPSPPLFLHPFFSTTANICTAPRPWKALRGTI